MYVPCTHTPLPPSDSCLYVTYRPIFSHCHGIARCLVVCSIIRCKRGCGVDLPGFSARSLAPCLGSVPSLCPRTVITVHVSNVSSYVHTIMYDGSDCRRKPRRRLSLRISALTTTTALLRCVLYTPATVSSDFQQAYSRRNTGRITTETSSIQADCIRVFLRLLSVVVETERPLFRPDVVDGSQHSVFQ